MITTLVLRIPEPSTESAAENTNAGRCRLQQQQLRASKTPTEPAFVVGFSEALLDVNTNYLNDVNQNTHVTEP
jgi:hypothetical protein